MAGKVSEILELLLRVAGTDEVLELQRAFGEVGDAAVEASAESQSLAEKLDKTAETADKTAKALDFAKQIEGTKAQLREASEGLVALNKEFDATDRSSKKVVAAYNAAEREIARLTNSLIRQETAFARQTAGLTAAGVDVSKLAAEEARLRTEVERTSSELRASAGATLAAAQAQRELRQRLDDADEQMRRQSKAAQISAEALRQHRAAAAQAEAAQERLAASSGRTVGIFSRLRTAIAGLGAYLGFREAKEGVQAILEVGDASEKALVRLEALYKSQEQANRVFAELRTIADDNGKAFDVVFEAAAKLTTFGLDPLDGTLQGLIDKNAELGDSQQTLEGLVLALGQAWSKQKLQGEEILQLIERGVPVWDLLAKATGKNVVELQELSEKGKLGRDVIKQLIDEIAQSSQGAAAKNLSTLGGLFDQVRAKVRAFLQEVSDVGVLDYFKDQVTGLLNEVNRLATTGELREYAIATKDAIVTTTEAIKSSLLFIKEHAAGILAIAKAYAAVKVAQFVVGMGEAAASMLAASRASLDLARNAGGLRGALNSIPANIKIAFAAIGIELAIEQFIRLKEKIDAQREAESEALREQVKAIEIRRGLEARVDAIVQQYAAYNQEIRKTADEVGELTEKEAEQYLKRLENARKYFSALGLLYQRPTSKQSIKCGRGLRIWKPRRRQHLAR